MTFRTRKLVEISLLLFLLAVQCTRSGRASTGIGLSPEEATLNSAGEAEFLLFNPADQIQRFVVIAPPDLLAIPQNGTLDAGGTLRLRFVFTASVRTTSGAEGAENASVLEARIMFSPETEKAGNTSGPDGISDSSSPSLSPATLKTGITARIRVPAESHRGSPLTGFAAGLPLLSSSAIRSWRVLRTGRGLVVLLGFMGIALMLGMAGVRRSADRKQTQNKEGGRT